MNLSSNHPRTRGARNPPYSRAYADYEDIMRMTEELVSGMVLKLKGSYKIQYHANGPDEPPIEIDFTPPFKRFSMVADLEKTLDIKIPMPLESDETNAYLKEVCARLDAECQPPLTTARLLDTLTADYLEVQCVNPGFICDHPQIMSPLAGERGRKEGTGGEGRDGTLGWFHPHGLGVIIIPESSSPLGFSFNGLLHSIPFDDVLCSAVQLRA